MKSPAFQFYVKDWRSNIKLRRCSDAARGAWIDLLCLMHDSDEYGVLRWPLKEIANTASIRLCLLRELVDKGVLKGSDSNVPAYTHTPMHGGRQLPIVTLLHASTGPMWYCSRFVRDEWIRGRRGIGTRFTTERQPTRQPDDTPTRPPTRRMGERQGDGPAFASALDSINGLGVLLAGALDPPVDNPNPRLIESTSTPKAAAQSVERADTAIREIQAAKETAIPPPEDLVKRYAAKWKPKATKL